MDAQNAQEFVALFAGDPIASEIAVAVAAAAPAGRGWSVADAVDVADRADRTRELYAALVAAGADPDGAREIALTGHGAGGGGGLAVR